ncbi:MarR family transcriptional regulator [Actinobacteria bacterium YIM 96077]|uniref:MarR family transcriptional regulator n=1 Tax=Phytoactinopolyspora halophila TaxID=1981511 RepID=A0A329R261_9ACTN|nr:MarR family transcriptional regulator [Phytoactinopolyspora halophila]AYY12022.1 MarR family transcriptional regulator [Actinobacteria bacterium YIM 96077]RAW18744.1 MarR family transcriptional regulator [Phytoactinopolyspora halophila]
MDGQATGSEGHPLHPPATGPFADLEPDHHETPSVTERFQQVFWAAKKAMTDAAETAYRRHGVRSGQQFILMALWEEDGLSPGELARRLQLATPTVTKATARMELAGLVERRPHPSDRRLVRIHLTDAGLQLRRVMADEMRALSERALTSLDESEREDFVRFLAQLRTNVTPP